MERERGVVRAGNLCGGADIGERLSLANDRGDRPTRLTCPKKTGAQRTIRERGKAAPPPLQPTDQHRDAAVGNDQN